MRKVVPSWEEVKSMLPFNDWIMFFTMANPKPIPPVLVVNFGSKILVKSVGDIPEPLSDIAKESEAVEMVKPNFILGVRS